MGCDYFVHQSAINESSKIGKGTRIWAFAHIMKGAVIGADCNIGGHAFVESGAVIGRGVTLKNGVAVWSGVVIRDYAFIGPYVVFTNDRQPRSPRAPFTGDRYHSDKWMEPLLIEEGATIGANATLLCGIKIGAYAMVAAGSTVTRDVPPFTLVKGSPARVAGLVCMCGNRLSKSDPLVCHRCNRKYMKTENGITLKDEASA